MTSYQDNAEGAEEKYFLKNYTIPLIQLNPMKTILVFAHQHNTFDKRILLKGGPNPYIRETKMKPSQFIQDKSLLEFYQKQ